MIKTIIFEKTYSVKLQFFRYIFVGGAAAVCDFSSLFILTDCLDINYLISATIAFLIGLTVNYILATLFVFPESIFSRLKEFTLYSIIGIVGLGFNDLTMYVCVEIFGLWYMFAKVVATIITLFWNFFGRKKIIFERDKR